MGLLVNHIKKWGYLHIPKTAGTSITDTYFILDSNTERITQHGTLNEFRDIRGYFIFTFVRNPYTRFGSWFSHERRSGKFQTQDEMIRFLERGLHFVYYPQSFFITKGVNPHKKINFIGKVEDIVRDINKINEHIGYRQISDIPRKNRNPILKKHKKISEKKLYKSLLKPKTIEFIEDYYREDFERFGYELGI